VPIHLSKQIDLEGRETSVLEVNGPFHLPYPVIQVASDLLVKLQATTEAFLPAHVDPDNFVNLISPDHDGASHLAGKALHLVSQRTVLANQGIDLLSPQMVLDFLFIQIS
jgi:hypothetical protein